MCITKPGKPGIRGDLSSRKNCAVIKVPPPSSSCSPNYHLSHGQKINQPLGSTRAGCIRTREDGGWRARIFINKSRLLTPARQLESAVRDDVGGGGGGYVQMQFFLRET